MTINISLVDVDGGTELVAVPERLPSGWSAVDMDCVRSCRTRRPRDAPRALRIAMSCVRATQRLRMTIGRNAVAPCWEDSSPITTEARDVDASPLLRVVEVVSVKWWKSLRALSSGT